MKKNKCQEAVMGWHSLRTSDSGTVDDPSAVYDPACTVLSHGGTI